MEDPNTWVVEQVSSSLITWNYDVWYNYWIIHCISIVQHKEYNPIVSMAWVCTNKYPPNEVGTGNISCPPNDC